MCHSKVGAIWNLLWFQRTTEDRRKLDVLYKSWYLFLSVDRWRRSSNKAFRLAERGDRFGCQYFDVPSVWRFRPGDAIKNPGPMIIVLRRKKLDSIREQRSMFFKPPTSEHHCRRTVSTVSASSSILTDPRWRKPLAPTTSCNQIATTSAYVKYHPFSCRNLILQL